MGFVLKNFQADNYGTSSGLISTFQPLCSLCLSFFLKATGVLVEVMSMQVIYYVSITQTEKTCDELECIFVN